MATRTDGDAMILAVYGYSLQQYPEFYPDEVLVGLLLLGTGRNI